MKVSVHSTAGFLLSKLTNLEDKLSKLGANPQQLQNIRAYIEHDVVEYAQSLKHQPLCECADKIIDVLHIESECNRIDAKKVVMQYLDLFSTVGDSAS